MCSSDLLTPGQDRLRQFLRFCRRENEHEVVRWLLERFQECVERKNGEHMGFIDDEDLLATASGNESGGLTQISDLLDAPVAGGIDLNDIDIRARRDRPAVLAFHTGMTVRSLVAVQGFGQNAGDSCLAGTLGTSKQVCVGGPASIDRPF